MLLRRDEQGVLAIGQPSHAWVSGQLARAWGNARFGAVDPEEEVWLAADQHDIGMAAWDLEPALNPDTGLPYGFTEMPLAVHMELWRTAAPRLLRQSRYAALLVALHGARLYEMRDLAQMPAGDAGAVRELIDELRTFADRLARSLQVDPLRRRTARPEAISRNSDLLWTWDYLSLALCLGWAPCTAKRAPSAGDPVDLTLTAGVGPAQVLLDPWPFRAETVGVRCEGQRLRGRYATENELRDGLAAAPWETLVVELAPARNA
jgi:hypothetical protein